MDNKITKTRLNDYFSYEWIVVAVMVIVVCFAWEIFYGIASVKPTKGQEFKYYYDLNLYYPNAGSLHTLLDEKGAFSYDVLVADHESIQEKYETLKIRLSDAEGDIIFTDSTLFDELLPDGSAKMKKARARDIIDTCPVYTLDQLLDDAREYLKGFLKEGVLEGEELDYANFEQNFDLQKIENNFNVRLANDNRFRSEENKNIGRRLEKERIQKLVKDVSDFKYFLDYAPATSFYNYTKYEELYFTYKDLGHHWSYYIDMYKPLYEAEVKVRSNARYGINIASLTGGRKTTTYFKIGTNTNSENVVMMAFNFKELQPDLQFETISFMATILREFSNFIPA